MFFIIHFPYIYPLKNSISIFLKCVLFYNRPEGQNKNKKEEGYNYEKNIRTAESLLQDLQRRQRLSFSEKTEYSGS